MAALLPHAVRESIARHGGCEAFVSGAARVTYEQFGSLVARFAALFRQYEIGCGERVAILLPNGVDAAAAVYGAWQRGAIAVPLAPQSAARDLAAWIGHCEPRAVLIADADRGRIDARDSLSGAPRLLCSQDWAPQARVDAVPAESISADDVALIAYTSGTTGAPKGVTLTHGNLAANAWAIIRFLQLQQSDSVLSALPFHYAYGASVLHTHLAVGARVVLEPNYVYPQVLVGTLARERVTGLAGVAAGFALLLSRVDFTQHELTALRYMTQAGGPMSRALTERLRAALPQARLFRMYGQTEATARLSWLAPESLPSRPESVGLPVEGVDIEVRDADGHAVPAGIEGEICARGPNIMRGYWRDEAATARVLRQGWLLTGDRGYIDAEGYLYVVGRFDDLIKTGAQRVNPADIEAVIAELPGVTEVAVVGVADALLGQSIKACVVSAGPGVLQERVVRRWCRERLAPHMVPRVVEFRTSLPRTASGKVRRFELEREMAQEQEGT